MDSINEMNMFQCITCICHHMTYLYVPFNDSAKVIASETSFRASSLQQTKNVTFLLPCMMLIKQGFPLLT